ncbi:MAG: hypothetical protein AAGF57_05980 [Pseudomonadota bacterium]
MKNMVVDLIVCSATPRHRMRLFALALLLSALSISLQAAKPEPYGEHFVVAGEQWSDAKVGVAKQGINVAPTPVGEEKRFLNHLHGLEGEGGPYSDALAEPLTDLARHHRQQGDLASARKAYQRALHVVRVNDGLYSERQVPILQELFELYRVSGDMETLDARYDYFFRLYGGGEPPFNRVRLGAALEYIRWQREAIRLQLSDSKTKRLLEIYTLNRDLLEAVAGDSDVDQDLYRDLVLSQLRNFYLIQSRFETKEELQETGPSIRMAATWGETEDLNQHRMEVIQRRSLRRGRELLEQLIASTPAEDTQAVARAYLELGDWNQWNDKTEEALAAYVEVERLLRDSDRDTLLQKWLGEPRELPANGAFWQPVVRPPGETPVLVAANFDVLPKGRADNIETIPATEEQEREASKVRRYLRNTRFRPRIADGEAHSTAQLARQYEVLD